MPARLRWLPLVFLSFLFTAWPLEHPGHWVSLPARGQLVIIGVSNRRIRRDWEIESARDDAARKALFYRGVKGMVRTVVSGAPGQGPAGAMEAALEPLAPGDYGAVREALSFDPEKDVTRADGAVFVRFTCPAPGAQRLDYVSAPWVNGEPLWIRRLPAIDGHITALGFAGQQRHVRETVNKSCESAAAALIVSQRAHIKTLARDDYGRGASSHIVETARGELQGFMALEMWINPVTKGVWTLAAAREMDTEE